VVLPSLPHPTDGESELASILAAVGQLWLSGAELDWAAVHGDSPDWRVSLPGYPFDRQRYPVEPGASLPEIDSVAARSGGREPITETERAVAAVFAEILGLDRVGADDDFFELGGDSLIAVALNSWVRRTYPIDLPAKTILMAATVADFASSIDERLAMEERHDRA
jgi:phthiocerol/phenolphthiocerol synthesis type-I polyketide synthase E